MIAVEVQGEAVPQGSMSAIPFHRPCPKCKRDEGGNVTAACGRGRMCVGGRELGANVMHGNADEVKAWRREVGHAVERQLDHVARGRVPVDDVNLVAWARSRPCAAGGHVTLGARIAVERPKGHWTSKPGILSSEGERNPEPWHKPDIDKLERALLDALTGLVYTDDAQVTTLVVEKTWAAWGEQPGTVLWLAPGRHLVAVATLIEARRPRTTGSLF